MGLFSVWWTSITMEWLLRTEVSVLSSFSREFGFEGDEVVMFDEPDVGSWASVSPVANFAGEAADP
jgi:hypothetical protein